MQKKTRKSVILEDYDGLLSGVVSLVEEARRASGRTINAIMTATYWEIGHRIVETEQGGKRRAGYGKELLKKLSADLTSRFGRGFSVDNLENMRRFYVAFRTIKISETASRKLGNRTSVAMSVKSRTVSGKSGKRQTLSGKFTLVALQDRFPLPWSAYVRVLSVKNERARAFYEQEALRGGWSVRQLDRQINSQFYERTALSKNKAAALRKGGKARPGDAVTPEEQIKDPYVLEFLDLKDEYSESDLEETLILHLEHFLLELGGDFTFVGRQKRLRIGDEWYRVDLIFFHRRLRCLVVIDLKQGKFTHADVGQMHMYLNYAREHWTHPDENPPVGLILCALKNRTLAKYALQGLPNKVMAAEYKTVLPDEKLIAEELKRTRKSLEERS